MWKNNVTGLVATIFVLASLPNSARAETCTLYEKWKKDYEHSTYSTCSSVTNYYEVTPTLNGGAGTFFSRKVPTCQNGTDIGCSGGDRIRSLDGTRPFYHIDPGSLSYAWIISLDGGGSCGAMRGDNAATACMTGTQDPNNNYGFNGYNVFSGGAWYDADYKEMTTRHPKLDPYGQPIYTVPNQVVGNGIMSPSTSNSYFYNFNKVIVNKSSFDRFMGNKTAMPEPYAGAYGTDDITLFFHGKRMIPAILKDLGRANGTFSVGSNCPNSNTAYCQEVPNFSAATDVVVVGQSGSAGGLIHGMEGIKTAITNVAPNARVYFLVASRMIPWLEGEAYYNTASGGHYHTNGDDIWDDVYSGSSTIVGDSNTNTPDAETTYNHDAYQSGGIVRDLLESWGDSTSSTNHYLDSGCKTAHGNSDWRCFDEGHVALNHLEENVFWFQSLGDGVHAGSSPLSFVPLADFGNGNVDMTPSGGFLFDPSGTWNFSEEKANRVVHTVDQMLLHHGGAGALGFYVPGTNCHTTVQSSAFWGNKITKSGDVQSLASSFYNWLYAIALGSPTDLAYVQDSGRADRMTWSFDYGHYGGGWTTSGTPSCP